jgi:hypothetical protein
MGIMDVKKYIEEEYPDYEDLVIFDGLDEAFIGVGFVFTRPMVCYSKDIIISILMERDCMTYEEALEFFEFNIAGMYAGEHTPLILDVIV